MTATTPADSEPAWGVWATLGEPGLLDPLARASFDWLCLDAQHGRFDDRALREGLDVSTAAGATAWVRVRSNDAGLIGRALDSGARGVIVPLVDTPADAADAVRSAFYPPRGSRSFGPYLGTGAQPTPTEANDSTGVAVMIETAAGLAAASTIAATPGIEGVFVGPVDLALSLGTTVDDLLADESPDSALRRIARAAVEAGVTPGAFAGSPGTAHAFAALGYRFIAATTDSAVLAAGAAGLRAQLT
ncbi:HpcH/HpaI aldolase family protein [Herbiconiux daphne]|uniref:Aldolase/citrate lyase family protein n=1 Tax=Herbiconiux daphne TaxID=2970914 RepID=A0ABT2GW87_9MICO|nr:aldolase/citrate lyase family protein [Herbiconiux daphne]MCS5732217.1 aldolase/citrate lyase family protein [Herbiconiux daphne]